MKASKVPALLPLLGAATASASASISDRAPPPCRFALDWTSEDILENTDAFVSDMLYWEGKFHVDGIAFNKDNGMTYDGSQIDYFTGERTEKHSFSASSKESLQIMLYANAIDGSKDAARFLSPDDDDGDNALKSAIEIVLDLMEKKLKTYNRFNEQFPGYGGAMPWVITNETDIRPQTGWDNRTPALDNGELWWAVYAYIHALEKKQSSGGGRHHDRYSQQAKGWQEWLDFVTPSYATIFHRGRGQICAVTAVGDMRLPVDHPDQTYECENDDRINDPYEGELVPYIFQLMLGDDDGFGEEDKEALWEAKRDMLVEMEYEQGGVGPITVERGYWFSAHEPWKTLELPYHDVDLIRRLYRNHERVRTCDAAITTRTPGLFASVNNVTDLQTGAIAGYISPAGIPSVANQTEQYREVVTPYASWPVVVFDRAVGLAWWRNMAAGKKMQNQYGSTESTRVDGEGVSALLTWDSKVLTVVALLGGVQDLVRDRMKQDGIYHEFIRIAEREYSMVFGDLKGEDVEFCLPSVPVPDAGLDDFTECSA